MARPLLLYLAIAIQTVFAGFFLANILSSFLGLPPISWRLFEYIELGAATGLVMGVILGAVAVRQTLARNRMIEQQLRAASGAFITVVKEQFADWGLTQAEQDVALFAIKGLKTQEIAALRNTSEGTVKAQTNAIYRKAGVSGRPQLLSLFIEELMAASPAGQLTGNPADKKGASTKAYDVTSPPHAMKPHAMHEGM